MSKTAIFVLTDNQAFAIVCYAYMGVEQGRPEQLFMPDKGKGQPGRKAREKRELDQAIQEFRDDKPFQVLSTESKVDTSSPLPKLHKKRRKKF